MMFKRAKVVMLPTNQKAEVDELTTNDTIPSSMFIMSNKVLSGWKQKGDHLRGNHLYITSDDEIQEGDWVLYDVSDYAGETAKKGYLLGQVTDTSEVGQANAHYITTVGDWHCDDCKKIIATTDSNLIQCPVCNDPKFKGTFVDHICRGLPQPSQSFIEKYIEKYNAGTPIVDVMVEYDKEDCPACFGAGYEDGGEDYANEKYLVCGGVGYESKLKVNSKDNTITIKSIKNSWTREEVETLLFNLAKGYGMMGSKQDVEAFNQWIKENL